ncbi:DNA polymerase delta subunit 3 [Heteronotia binoei]|uniref:DNA polymerase delta subunit 3 n=1 Tax=Heteronotia binoei TaxID=13085 RepID=UPI0029301F25|nr:DNA polymerase delta subunit 3 [Heteronotia binoei]
MEDELYLENIDEFVTDQNRVVTYKWLSYTLGVHVNQAKQMLYDYVERKRKENSGAQLHVVYLVAGNIVQNGHTCHKVAVVREDQLEALKAKLSSVASVHVYSIQKAMLKDSSPLYNTDYDIVKANLQNCSKFSAIHCAAAVARTAAEMAQAEAPAQVDSQVARGTSTGVAAVANGHAPSTASKQTAQRAKGIMGMFAAKPVVKTQDAHKESKTETKETQSASAASSKPVAKGNVLNNFFGKAAMNKDCTGNTEPEEQKEDKAAAKPPVSPAETKSPSETAEPRKPGKKAETAKAKQDKKRAKRAEVSDDEKETEGLKRKRRRIKRPQSESSDDEDVPATSVTPEAKELSPEPVLEVELAHEPTEAPAGGKKRKRKRVLKSKTFVDEEGCIVTEKVYESESCTDSGEEFRSRPAAAHKPLPARTAKKEPKEDKKGTKKGAATLKANKQASIMGFFQKK